MEEKLMTTKELCDYLKLSRMTIERYRKKGMPFLMIGSNIRFKLNEVLEWINSNKE